MPELEKLIGELGIDEDTHVVVVPAGVQRTDFGSAARIYWTLKVAGVTEGFDPRRRLRRLGRRTAMPVETGASKPSPKIFTATLDKALLAEAGEVAKIEQTGGATLIDARPASFFAGKEKAPAAQGLWPHSGRGECRQRDVLRSRRPTG